MDVHEVALLKKLMHRERQPAARAKHRAEQIRARPQMRDRAQELRRVTLLLERVTGFRPANQPDARSAHFPLLARRGRRDQIALDLQRGAGREVDQMQGRSSGRNRPWVDDGEQAERG